VCDGRVEHLGKVIPTAPGNIVTFSQPIPSASCEHRTAGFEVIRVRDRNKLFAQPRHVFSVHGAPSA
jgi:hypothetical protein